MPDLPRKERPTENVNAQSGAQLLKPDRNNIVSTNSIKAELRVNEIPRVKIDTGLDIVTLSSFFITALIVIVTTIFTFKSARNTATSQENIANARELSEIERLRAEKRASNRQEWINTLRSDLAAYVGAVMNTWNLHQMQAGRASYQQSLNDELKWQESNKWAYEYNLSLRELQRLKAKIILLLNPTEGDSNGLINLIDNAATVATSGSSVISECDAIIEASRPILKKEWEKVKALQ
jgi:hypothetical protein